MQRLCKFSVTEWYRSDKNDRARSTDEIISQNVSNNDRELNSEDAPSHSEVFTAGNGI